MPQFFIMKMRPPWPPWLPPKAIPLTCYRHKGAHNIGPPGPGPDVCHLVPLNMPGCAQKIYPGALKSLSGALKSQPGDLEIDTQSPVVSFLPFTKPPLFQENRLTCGGSLNLGDLVVWKVPVKGKKGSCK